MKKLSILNLQQIKWEFFFSVARDHFLINLSEGLGNTTVIECLLIHERIMLLSGQPNHYHSAFETPPFSSKALGSPSWRLRLFFVLNNDSQFVWNAEKLWAHPPSAFCVVFLFFLRHPLYLLQCKTRVSAYYPTHCVLYSQLIHIKMQLSCVSICEHMLL